ncbi:MAG TPA: AAA family ATPase, partial [Campylobacterales bacterium]|nr:AAA family ATPase [Campylobacterales bacterium]
MKRLPIGISDFKQVIEEDNYFIDKSMLIHELINSNAQVTLLPRPRRFGKTLNLSMLRYFFNNREDNTHLFKDLAISKTLQFNEYVGKYPIIFLSFKDIKSTNIDDTIEGIKSLITEVFGLFEEEISKLELSKKDSIDVENILYFRASNRVYQNSLRLLSSLLYKIYNKKVVILIDEYDTPIHASYLNGYYSEFIDFIRNLLSGAFKDNDYLYKGVITGILRVSRESIFSGLNNIATYTIVDYEYSNRFGFTIDETQKILTDFNLSDIYKDVSDSYNGYKIGKETIFNPWSILNFVSDKEHRLLPYWANTSSNELIKHLIKISSMSFKKSLESWLNGEAIRTPIDSNIVFSEIEHNDKNVYSLLFFSGYLKCINKELKDKVYYCDLAIPNQEVEYIFRNIISSWINESFRHDRLDVLLNALITGEIKLFEKLFSQFVLETLSFYDVNRKNEEAVYHAFLLGILVSLTDYEVISNRETGLGRVDIILLHKEDKNRLAIIMELKTIDEFEEETKEIALDKALNQ